MTDIESAIRQVLEAHGRLGTAVASLKDDDDLYQRGLSSHASVNVMLGIEDAFEIEIPEALLTRATFRTIGSIRETVESLGVTNGPGESLSGSE
jgi:acyl carrier protein